MRSTIERHARTLTLACACGFMVATVYPLPRNPFGESHVTALQDGGVRILDRSLLVSDRRVPILDAPAYVEGRFAIDVLFRAARADADGPARIVTYSLNPGIQNWVVAQENGALEVRHRRHMASFPDAIRAGVRQHFVISLEDGRVTLFRRGHPPETRRLGGRPRRRWDSRCRFSLGNELTGDRPWIGDIERARIYDRPVSADEAARLLAGRADIVPDVELEYRAGSWFLGPEIPLRIVPWPWSLKIDQMIEGAYPTREPGLLDRIVNVLGTMPLGFFLGAWLRRRRAARVLLAAATLQLGLSVVVEISQIFGRYRFGDPADVATNVAGAVLGALLWRLYARTRA